ncbi:MAG: AMP-binding protein [Acidimicrobiales bacterium]
MDDNLVLPNLLAARCEESPDQVFIQHVDGSSLTYSQLESEVQRWCGGLSALGVAEGDTLLVMLDNSFESALTWLAASRLGAIEVQVNTAYVGRILTHVANNAGARVAVVAERFVERFADLNDDLDSLEVLVVLGGDVNESLPFETSGTGGFVADSTDGWSRAVKPHEMSCILYTSGTTGPSKGVIIPWAQAHASATGCIPLDGLGPDDAWYSPYPMFHMSGKLALYASAIFGGRFVFRDSFKTDRFWDDVRGFGCTCTMLIGSTPAFVWNEPASSGDADHPLKNVLMAPTPEDPDAFTRRFGFRICSVFNMTEISCPVMSGWELGPKGSAGRLRPGYEVRIVDTFDNALGPGELGEITVRAEDPWVLMAGYWRNAEATVDAWRNQWFHTGDAGTYDEDGYFYFVDRFKDAIRRRGENISSMELEAVANDCPAIVESAAVGVPSEYGEEEIMLYVVPAAADFEPSELIDFLEPRLPGFMVPRFIASLDELPKTPTEKVRKQVLRDSAGSRAAWDRERARTSG